jgi:hypothetical protein
LQPPPKVHSKKWLVSPSGFCLMILFSLSPSPEVTQKTLTISAVQA